MGIFTRSKTAPVSADQAAENNEDNLTSVGGEYRSNFIFRRYMSTDELLTNSSVASCVKIISDAIAQLPCIVYRKTAKGRIRAANMRLYYLLKTRPNPENTPSVFKTQLIMWLLLRGNTYIFVERDGTAKNEIEALWVLNSDRMRVERDTLTSRIIYNYQKDTGELVRYTSDKVLHIPAYKLMGLLGMSPIEYNSHVVQNGLDLDSYTARYFNEELQNKIVVEIPEGRRWSNDDTKNLVAYFKRVYAGIKNKWKPLIMYNGNKAHAIDLKSNVDSQLVENRDKEEREIAKIFRVPLFMLGAADSKFNNNEQLATFFLQYTLSHWLKRLEEYFNLLVPIYEQDTAYCEFDVDVMLRGDYKTRADINKQNLLSGLSTINEINALENKELLPPEIGDIRFIPVNLMPLTQENVSAYMAEQKQKVAQTGFGTVKNNSEPDDDSENKKNKGDKKDVQA